MNKRLKALIVAGVILVPLFLIFYVWAAPAADPAVVIDPKSPNYPAAVQSLQSTSDLLVTVAMAVLGAIGLLMVRLKRANAPVVAFAALGFVGALMSIFFASRLGFTSAFTLAATKGDIATLLALLDNQAISTLVAGLSLAAIAVLEALDEPRKS